MATLTLTTNCIRITLNPNPNSGTYKMQNSEGAKVSNYIM